MPRNFLRQIAAILLGNAVYFQSMPHLPAALRHRPRFVDPGLLLDFALCVICYFVIGLIPGERRDSGSK